MCLGVPGQVVEIREDSLGMTMGKVSFGGIRREVCLAYTPKVEIGQYVLVHVGFAIQQLDEDEARSIFEALDELERAAALDEIQTDPSTPDESPSRDGSS